MKELFSILLAVMLVTPAVAFDDSDAGGGYEAPNASDQDPELGDRDCEDCDPVPPSPEPEPEPALDNGRDGTCSGCDPYSGR